MGIFAAVKETSVMNISKINKVEIRNLQREDYDQLASSFTRVYADGSDVFWTPAQIDKLIRIFPEGQIVVVVDDKIVGCALSIIVNYNLVKGDHTYAQVTGNETFDTHTRKGNILYGIEVFIHPDYRGLRLARRMYEYRKELCEKLNLKAIMFGGRLPNYHKYADRMRPKEYIDKVRKREIYDPVLLFQLSNDFHVRKVMRNYLPNDEESRHYACLLQWDNIYYQAPTEEYVQPKTTVRVGLVQWQMRSYRTLDDLFEQVEFFVDSVSRYQSDFASSPNISTHRSWPASTMPESRRPSADWPDIRTTSANGSSDWPSSTTSTSSREACLSYATTDCSTTWDSSAAGTEAMKCTRNCTSRPTR